MQVLAASARRRRFASAAVGEKEVHPVGCGDFPFLRASPAGTGNTTMVSPSFWNVASGWVAAPEGPFG